MNEMYEKQESSIDIRVCLGSYDQYCQVEVEGVSVRFSREMFDVPSFQQTMQSVLENIHSTEQLAAVRQCILALHTALAGIHG